HGAPASPLRAAGLGRNEDHRPFLDRFDHAGAGRATLDQAEVAMRLAGRKALVVGIGKSGVAAARLLATHGAFVAVADDKDAGALADPLRRLQDVPHERYLGGLRDEAVRGRDLIVMSPGVPLSTAVVAAARARGVEVIGEIELASRFVDEPVLGVTGTNGKSTTTALTAHLLTSAGKKVFAGGNLGEPLSNRVLQGG